jgi:hypothetical protein
VSTATLPDWLNRLGYADEPAVLHAPGDKIREGHPYAFEIETLLRPDGAIRARAVFDVEGVPTVVFVAGSNGHFLSIDELDAIRQRIWIKTWPPSSSKFAVMMLVSSQPGD